MGSTATFRGFLVIAHVPGEDRMLLGTFTPQNGSQQILDCSVTRASNEAQSTIAHNNSERNDFQNMTFSWTAPSNEDGMVDFRYVCVPLCVHVDLNAPLQMHISHLQIHCSPQLRYFLCLPKGFIKWSKSLLSCLHDTST